jgi:hypothetical protein
LQVEEIQNQIMADQSGQEAKNKLEEQAKKKVWVIAVVHGKRCVQGAAVEKSSLTANMPVCAVSFPGGR